MKLTLFVGPPHPAADSAVARALATQAADGGATAVHPFPGGVLAVAGRPGTPATALVVRATPAGDLLAVAGTPVWRGGRVADLLDAVERMLAAGAPSAEVTERLTSLDGHFAAALWHAAERRTVVVTDALGMQPLYVGAAAGGTIYATELRAVAAAAERAEFDPAGWGAFFYIGHPVGDRTPLAGVRRMPPALVRVHDAARAGSAPVDRHWWEWPAGEPLPVEEAADRIVAEMREDVAAALREAPETTLLFSGGFDSRLILALIAETGARPRLLCHSHPDENADADGRFASAAGRVYGLEVERVDAEPDFFAGDGYLRFLARNEVLTPSLHLFIAQVSRLVTPELRAVWDGCLTGPLLKFSGGAVGMDAYLAKRVAPRRAAARAAAARVLHPDWLTAMDAGFDQLVAEERARIGDVPTASWRFQVESRARMRTGQNPFQVYASVVPALAPGLSRGSWAAACAVDPEDRRTLALCYAVFRRHFPEALRVPVASGADILNPGGGLRTTLRYHDQRVRAAVASVAQRPKVARALGAVGVRTGFRWAPSPFPAAAVARHALPSSVVDTAALAALRPGAPSFDESAETVFYLESWRRLMLGERLG
jgi:hypothetical protein